MAEIVKGMRPSGQPGETSIPARKTLSNLAGSVGAVVAATESARSSSHQRGTPAAAVRALAAAAPTKAWDQLQKELDVQRMVWQSVIVTKVKAEGRPAFQAQTDDAARMVQGILDTRGSDLQRALASLEQLLQRLPKDSEGADVLNSATRQALQNVLDQHEVAPLRLDLAERLDVADVPATLPRGPEQKADVDRLVTNCRLGDKVLECEVRQLLLLPIPQSLGTAVGTAKTSSKLSAVSGKRSSPAGVGATASRKDSAKAHTQPTTRGAAPKTGFGPGSFDPPEREVFDNPTRASI